MKTFIDITIEHYIRPEVKVVITRYTHDGDAWGPLNGDDRWYKQGAKEGEVQLTTPEDYDSIIENQSTLYATISLCEAARHVLEAGISGMKHGENVERIELVRPDVFQHIRASEHNLAQCNASRCPNMVMTLKIKRFANLLCHSRGGL